MDRKSSRVVSIILFIIGIGVIYKSAILGLNKANSYLANNGGSMDTSQFMNIMQGEIISFRLIGLILSLIGGLIFIKSINFVDKATKSEEYESEEQLSPEENEKA
jgi:phosphotransferase system  glucose/maltose/N-acetylglucosamine-specific IIC component